MKKALITGITGQDGSYMADFLLHKGYEVHGLIRRASSINTGRIDHIYRDPHSDNKVRLHLHDCDLSVGDNLENIICKIRPEEIYHLGAQSQVHVSFDLPEYTGNVTGLATTRILEAIRIYCQDTHFYQASTSEMFGGYNAPQNEKTMFHPRSPYATAKLYAYWITRNYREAYGIFTSNGILFNHESPRRGETFVTRKITRTVASIVAGKEKYLYLGNLDAKRDWGYAPEYVEAMWLMLQHEKPDDFVIGIGETHSVREFLIEAFSYVGLDYEKHVRIDPRYYRPSEVDLLQSDPTKAKIELNWTPKIKFHELVQIMVDADLELLDQKSPGKGKQIVASKFDGWHSWECQVVSKNKKLRDL